MVEIHHIPAPPPEPALPILASHLLAVEEKQRRRFSARGHTVKTGCAEIDDYMLRGGCERGIVLGVSAGAEEGRLLSLHLLSSILISQLPILSSNPSQRTKAKASIIDTTGSFPITLLAQVLKSRLLESNSRPRPGVEQKNSASRDDPAEGKETEDQVRECLELVAISRVFDIEGLWEVLGELQHDSGSSAQDEESSDDEFGVEIIIIDNMTHLITELLTRKERTEAHTLLTTLSHALHCLSQTHNILTILHNTTTSSTSSTTKNPQHDPSFEPHHPNQHKPNPNPQPTSIFASNPTRPSLGQIFAQFPDLHLLISALPKTRVDAQLHYDDDNANINTTDQLPGSASTQRGPRYCLAIEVLKDETPSLTPDPDPEHERNEPRLQQRGRRFADREQRWAAVEVRADGLALVDAFPAKRGWAERERSRETERRVLDGGSIARIYGFGGRRV